MSRAVDERVARGLARAQGAGSLLIPSCERDQKALRRRAGKGILVEPIRGAFADPGYWRALAPDARALHIMRAISQLYPGWTFCGPSAALAYGLPISWRHVGVAHVVGSRSSSWPIPGITFHHLGSFECELVGGLSLTSFWRTAFDCAAMLDFPDALAVLDGAARMSGASGGQIAAHFKAAYAQRPGVRKAVRVARYADGRSESGGESIARATFIELGYQIPELQVRVADPLDPSRVFRVDGFWFSVDGVPVFFELDGMAKSEDLALTRGRSKERVLADERLRESLLTFYGARVLRVTYRELFDRWRLAEKLDRFGVPRCASGIDSLPYGKTWRASYHVYDDMKLLVSEAVA